MCEHSFVRAHNARLPVIEVFERRTTAYDGLPIMTNVFHNGIALEIQDPQIVHGRHDVYNLRIFNAVVLQIQSLHGARTDVQFENRQYLAFMSPNPT